MSLPDQTLDVLVSWTLGLGNKVCNQHLFLFGIKNIHILLFNSGVKCQKQKQMKISSISLFSPAEPTTTHSVCITSLASRLLLHWALFFYGWLSLPWGWGWRGRWCQASNSGSSGCLSKLNSIFIFYFETGSQYIVQASLKLLVTLPEPPRMSRLKKLWTY